MDGTIGGSHFCLFEIVKYLDKKAFEPFVLFFNENTMMPAFAEVCPVIVFNRMNRLNFRKRKKGERERVGYSLVIALFFQKMANLILHSIPDFFHVISFIHKNKIAIVHINNAPYLTDWLIACKLLRRKCISHLRGNWTAGAFRRVLIRFYDLVIPISTSVTTHMARQGVNIEKFVLLNDGIDVKSLPSLVKTNMVFQKPEGLSGAAELDTVGVVGNIKPWKGQHVLVEAMRIVERELPNARCLIIGDVGSMKEDIAYHAKLKDMVERYGLGDKVILTGFRRDVLDLVRSLKILVHTSVEPEPFGRVILEGMLLGKTVIATAHGGPLDIIEDGICGYLLPPGDAKALADKIVVLLRNPILCEKIGRAARTRVTEKFSVEFMMRRLEGIYHRLLPRKDM